MNIKRKTRLRAIRLSLVIASGLVALPATLGADAKTLGDLRGVFRANFNHDGSRVIVRHRDGDVGIWKVPAGTRVAGDLAPNTSSDSYVMSPDAKMVLVGLKEGRARVFDAGTARAISPILDLPLPSETETPAIFSPDGSIVVIFSAKEAAAFDVRTGKRAAIIPLPAGATEEESRSAAFTTGGAQCLLMDGGGVVTRYDTKEWKPLGKPMAHPPAESAYDFGFNTSEDGKWLVTFDGPGENGPEGNLQVWDAVAHTAVGRPVAAVNGLTGRFLGTNRILISPGRGEATVRDLPSMEVVYSLRPHDDVDGPNVEVSPDRKWILAWGPDRILDLVDAATGKRAGTLNRSAGISQVMIAPDSSAFYAVYDNSAFFLEKHHDNYIVKLSPPELNITDSLRILDFISTASLSPDGKRLLVLQGSDEQERLLFFDAANLKPLK